ncbi:SLC13 family permease [Pseudotabrizicola alkalilacus]|uniref:SLC13 family permease n=1 Tax=Pseudotabrizicola alkalilacus TaxID=2305252 RepID=UPI0018F25560|nr:SLC13 family permease [Pseudotabrizicola alkalilacus]
MIGILRAISARLAQDWLLLGLIAVFPVMLWAVPRPPAALFGLVDWKTVAALAGLMVLSRGLEVSGLIDRSGRWIIGQIGSLRGLAFALVVFAAALSAVVTNDVALFVTVPLTVGLARMVDLPLGRLVIFQALAVNAGSALSPVGNPQNLFLWQTSGVGFGQFTLAMMPIAATMMALLLALIPFGFGKGRLAVLETTGPLPLQRGLMVTALATYPLFLVAVNAELAVPSALAVIAVFVLCFRSVLRGVDWPLLLVFVLMFINLGLLGQMPGAADVVAAWTEGQGAVYALGAGLSQIMSNVPAAIFLAQFTDDWRALAWGINVGGFGLAIGSLANLIALRLSGKPGLWREFHLWSLAMLLGSFAVGAGLLALG